MMDTNVKEQLTSLLEKHSQSHLLQFWDLLTDEQKIQLHDDIKSIDFDEIIPTFRESTTDKSSANRQIEDDLLEPPGDSIHSGVTKCTPEELNQLRERGLKEISDGNVAVLLMAGGQGTRLGVEYPKGMYNVGLPSGKSLYQLQGERIRRLEELAFLKFGKKSSIPWYIMTSEHTKIATEEFFSSHDYFGLSRDSVIIFEQGTLPCFTFEGKIILDKPYKIARSPDGNGGLYRSLDETGVLVDMDKRGIKYVHVYGVDNILVKMADPTFIGYCVTKKAAAGAKVVEKSSPTEAVGIICKVQGKFKVVEYSEVSTTIAEKRNEDGLLTFRCGSICNHFFTVEFLKDVSRKKLTHHVARKKIPFVDSKGETIKPDNPNGIKLEKFVFDVFEFTQDLAIWEVIRGEEFAPLKNSESASTDNPKTARESIYYLHGRYCQQAGGILVHDQATDDKPFVCEISPLVSYEGENLESYVKGITFVSPLMIERKREVDIESPKSSLIIAEVENHLKQIY
ncbi:UDP-N-acetylhexosamine pyrophosphorylase-like protein 1 [Panonychus citri]|uniref:UDP-N-acetylhexosamine pyrophosphorylase-like protein 1 n=1 Tax=Panonychus citri TaxID=50023 RepID=UPI0023080011|nr:UDP-N-acetylhexosamine pyrophosphorylase-like protein 1 [Panonychus citri]